MSRRPKGGDAPGRAVGDDEARLWQRAMRDVDALPDRDVGPAPDRPIPKAAKSHGPRPAAKAPAAPARALPDLEHGTAPGVDKRTAMRLKRGQMTIDARIDLHGLTRDEAHRALVAFVQGAADAGRVAVAFSSLLPATNDQQWHERERFVTAFEQLRPVCNTDLESLLGQVDSQFEEFAPVLKVSAPTHTLVQILEPEPMTA